VILDEGSATLFDDARTQAPAGASGEEWGTYAILAGQTTYARWPGLLEALISSDGHRISCRRLPGSSEEALHTYLLGAALSFALIRLGIEPLHSTVLEVDGGAVGLMGDCGFGKSSLGAAFLQAGYRLLTDDLLVLSANGAGFHVHPGAPRIKLFPAIARRLLGRRISGTSMNDLTPKLIIPLREHQVPSQPVPLKAIYVLARPRPVSRERSRLARVTIRRLNPRQACVELIANTFNMAVTDAGRMERQLGLVSAVAAHVPIKRISYPRIPSMLAGAREAILRDLSG
jgi:hypothetical protein